MFIYYYFFFFFFPEWAIFRIGKGVRTETPGGRARVFKFIFLSGRFRIERVMVERWANFRRVYPRTIGARPVRPTVVG